VKRRVRVVASSYRAIDRSVTRWIVVTMVEWSSEVRWELVPNGIWVRRRCCEVTLATRLMLDVRDRDSVQHFSRVLQSTCLPPSSCELAASFRPAIWPQSSDFYRPTQCVGVAFAVATWLSVTSMYCTQTTESIIMRPSHDCSLVILSFPVPNVNPIARG